MNYWKKNKIFITTVALTVFLLFIAFLLNPLLNNESGNIALINQNGKTINQLNLNKVSEEYEFSLSSPNGSFNIIKVKNGEISVVDASCPDKVCIKRGILKNGGLPIICLPNKLEIILIDSQNEVDGVVR